MYMYVHVTLQSLTVRTVYNYNVDIDPQRYLFSTVRNNFKPYIAIRIGQKQFLKISRLVVKHILTYLLKETKKKKVRRAEEPEETLLRWLSCSSAAPWCWR